LDCQEGGREVELVSDRSPKCRFDERRDNFSFRRLAEGYLQENEAEYKNKQQNNKNNKDRRKKPN
jgi:hypothetical protein